MLQTVTCTEVPAEVDGACVLRLTPVHADDAYYAERTDRHIGWITPAEQNMIRSLTVGIAGCGGMGGLLASIFLRLGVGELRIADSEMFDPSNINRQFAASRFTVGKSKALETARELRRITDDTTIIVYPQGIGEHTVEPFVEGCDVIIDEIEFFVLYPRLLLHRSARAWNIPVFVCDTVGFGTRLFLFEEDSPSIEDMLQCSISEAQMLHQEILQRTLTPEAGALLLKRLMEGFVPQAPTYREKGEDLDCVLRRLGDERRASIIATNPPLAAGFVSDHVLLHLLRSKGGAAVPRTAAMPSYLYFDAAKMHAEVLRHPVFV